MSKLKASYESKADVPQDFESAYTEQDGKFVLTGEVEFKTQEDIDKILQSKRHIDSELSQVKDSLKAEQQKNTEISNELEIVRTQQKEGFDESKISELVEKRVRAGLEAITAENETLKTQNNELTGQIQAGTKGKFVDEFVGNFSESISKEARAISDMLFERQEDNSYLTKEYFGIPAGLTAEQAQCKITEIYPHWAKQNIAGHGKGATQAPAVSDKNKRFKELIEKQTTGSISRNEKKELRGITEELRTESGE